MAAEGNNNRNESYPIEPRFKSLFENDQIQHFLHRHGLATDGGIPLRKEEIEERLQQIDDQSSVDVLTQSVIETALDIKRPLGKSDKRNTTRNSKQSIENNPYVTIYDNSCAITMIYCGLKPLQNDTLYSFKIQGDEIIVMQYQTNTGSIMVYKSFLRPNDEFTFKSHRLLDTPFTIAVYINGVIDSRVSICCEHGYLKQRHLQSKRSLFQLLFVSGGTPCFTCQTNDLMDSSISDNEETKSEWISLANTDHTALSSCFHTISCGSEPLGTNDSPKTYQTKSDSKTISSIFIPLDAEISPEIIQRQVTKTDEKQSAPTIEKMIDNEETEDDVKNEEQSTNPIKQTDISTFKQNNNNAGEIKIMNEEEEEGQKSISSVANHEMQQLLSKYLLLLLPSSKLWINNNTISTTMNTSLTNTIQKLVVPISSDSKMTSFDTLQSNLPRENVEICVLIWLDMSANIAEDTIISHTKLRAIINSLFTFQTITETINFIRKSKEKKTFLIISDSFAWELIENLEIKELSQLDSIYIFCHDKSKHQILPEQHHKVRGIFTHIDPLCTHLKEDVQQTLNDLLPISVAPNTSHKTKSNLDKEKQVTFLCAQLHHELLLTLEYSIDVQLNLVEFSLNIYQDNKTEREFIEELRNEYHPSKAIWWYTRPTFLQKMLHAALFHQDISLLYKLHFFIKDLHTQLEQLHHLYKPSLKSRKFTVYRGVCLPMKVFDQTIRQEINNLLAFNTFLLTSLNKNIALKYARNKSNDHDQSILFQIEIDTKKFQHPFADISHLSALECDYEILFSIGTVFRIDRVVEEKSEDGIWIVYLSSINENDKQFKCEIKQIQITLFNFFKRVWQVQIKRGDPYQIATSYINMARIYYKQNQYKKSLDFYQKALENLLELSSPNPLTIAIYHSNIAMVYIALEQQGEALKFYEQAFKIRMKYCELNDPLLVDTLHTIGHIYREKKEFDKALKQYYKALKIQPISFESSLKHNSLSIAATHINIALIYQQHDQIDQALEHFLKALDYQQDCLLINHPTLPFLYNNIASIYYQLKQFDLALQNYLLTLQIEENSLPKNHKTLSITYTNIATSYEQLKNYDQAINYAEKAVNQLKLHRSKDNSDIQIKHNYLNKLLKDKNN